MVAQELKDELHELIENIDDAEILVAIKILLAGHTSIIEEELQEDQVEEEVWEDLPKGVRDDIDAALAESERGESIPQENVWEYMEENKSEYIMDSKGVKELFKGL